MGDWTWGDLRTLVRQSEIRRLVPGEYLFREGEPGEHVFLIRRGRLEILSEQASLRRIAIRGPGELVGEMALLDIGGLRSASVRALDDAVVRALGREAFESFLDDHPRLGRRLSQLLSNRIRAFQHDIIEEIDDQPRLGHHFGSYLLLEELGRGGMGGVFRARQAKTDRLVALKVAAGHHADLQELRERFVREGEMLAALDHPHVVRVLERGAVRDTPYLVMELVEGEPLSARLRRGPLSLGEMVDWFVPVTLALQHAHELGVAHRDVKPANILRSFAGEVKLVDFGLAVQDDAARLTQTGQHIGTPNYFAPERARAQPPDVERFSDQYSLGVSLFEAVTGQLPFRAVDPLSLLMQHVNSVPPVPSSLRPDLPAELDGVILRLLAKDPAARFQDMGAVAGELAAFARSGLRVPPDADEMSQTMGFES